MSKKGKTLTPCHCLCKKNLNRICMLLFNLKRPLSKPIFISHHVMCSSLSCCNHLNNMLINVKLIVIQLELNGIGYIMVFHSYSKFASNTWYALICKFEKCKPNSQKITWVHIYLVGFFFKKKIEIGYKINRKTNVIFWNFKDPKNGKIRGGGGAGFRTNIIKEKNSSSI